MSVEDLTTTKIYWIKNRGQNAFLIGGEHIQPGRKKLMALTDNEVRGARSIPGVIVEDNNEAEAAIKPDGSIFIRYIGPAPFQPPSAWLNYTSGIICRSKPPATVVKHEHETYAFIGEDNYATGATIDLTKWRLLHTEDPISTDAAALAVEKANEAALAAATAATHAETAADASRLELEYVSLPSGANSSAEISGPAGDQLLTLRVAAGPSGPPGGAVYEHTQSSPSQTWIINHNLGAYPSVTLRTVGGVEFEGEVTHTSSNQAVVSLAIAMAGVARCS